ncbi:asparaginase [uncultured Desulfovibrio sp.]|uniref:Asparaginase n=1 Tax=Candidatus Desulfovibrio intestinavium TaxID=2838534 RepID=A0A9D2HNS6_9BACT|nr:asparaginase [uncultured Desulfovibrio sp.]HJA80066.1 asparaginase [Candidatus Desulfovibrio intestinavium]
MSGKVLVITTGGTIAMLHDAAGGGAAPARNGNELVDGVRGLERVCPLEVHEFANLPSPAMTPRHMYDLAALVRRRLEEEAIAGVVITHGTDTLEETAYFLDLTVDSPKPVCLTAAMHAEDELGPDGPRNLMSAVRVAASPQARGMGALVVMNDQLHAAREAAKTHAANVATFQSPWWGPIGTVDDDRIIFRRAPLHRQTLWPSRLERRADLIKIVTGDDGSLIDFALSHGTDGLVIESFGRGNVPPTVMPALRRAIDRGVIIVNATRTGGRVLDVYAYDGGMVQQRRLGVIMGGELSAAKARLKLLLALNLTPAGERPQRDAVARWFDTD